MNKEGLLRQHDEILELADNIMKIIDGGKIEENISEVVKDINTMSGKLRIHLSSEDNYLYPKLLDSEDVKLRDFGKKYYEEMKSVTEKYEEYKYKFNTSFKIKEDIENFKLDTKNVFKVLKDRINKENRELYPLIN